MPQLIGPHEAIKGYVEFNDLFEETAVLDAIQSVIAKNYYANKKGTETFMSAGDTIEIYIQNIPDNVPDADRLKSAPVGTAIVVSAANLLALNVSIISDTTLIKFYTTGEDRVVYKAYDLASKQIV